MSWPAVHRWLEHVRDIDPVAASPHLSPAGARAALQVALDALTPDALHQVALLPGRPYERATFVAARTVFTAPLEWCAVLLGRGTAVTVKHPSDRPGLTPVWASHARQLGLPLTATADRTAVQHADLVVAMGADPTIAEVRLAAPAARFLGFGHRFSVAHITDLDAMKAVAGDAALHDGMGCMSPVAVFTPHPLSTAVEALAAGMAVAEAALPRGLVAPIEGAAIRQRRALARATGIVAEGAAWSVHGLPLEHFRPMALPRSLAVHHVPDEQAVRNAMAPYSRILSTLGTDHRDVAALGIDTDSVRVCAPGQMQRPPLLRRHDGVDWVRAVVDRDRSGPPL